MIWPLSLHCGGLPSYFSYSMFTLTMTESDTDVETETDQMGSVRSDIGAEISVGVCVV